MWALWESVPKMERATQTMRQRQAMFPMSLSMRTIYAKIAEMSSRLAALALSSK